MISDEEVVRISTEWMTKCCGTSTPETLFGLIDFAINELHSSSIDSLHLSIIIITTEFSALGLKFIPKRYSFEDAVRILKETKVVLEVV